MPGRLRVPRTGGGYAAARLRGGAVRSSCGECCTPPDPTGACCFTDGSCSVTTATLCSQAGGTYQGDGLPCSPNPCPSPPSGACCNYDGLGGCQETTQAACDAAGGQWQGIGTNCIADCPPECCDTFGCWWSNRCAPVVYTVSFSFRVTRRCSSGFGGCSTWDFTVSDTLQISVPGANPSGDCPFTGCAENETVLNTSYLEQAQTRLRCFSSSVQQTCWPTLGIIMRTIPNAVPFFRARIACNPAVTGSQIGDNSMGGGCTAGTQAGGTFTGTSAGANCFNLPDWRVEYISGSYTAQNINDCGSQGMRAAALHERRFAGFTTAKRGGLLVPRRKAVRAATASETVALGKGCSGCGAGTSTVGSVV